MPYPSSLPLKVLQSEHPCYAECKAGMSRIEMLLKGGYSLKAQISKFLPQRPGEEPDLYADRLKKFTYRNILKDAIRKQAIRFANGSIDLTGISSTSEAFWQQWREDTNGKGRNEMALANEIFSNALKSGCLYLHIDKPLAPLQPRNKAEEEALGLLPYVNIYSRSAVINWGEEDDRLAWIKVRQIEPDTSNPLASEVLMKATWTFIDDREIARYESYVELDKSGSITMLLGSDGKPRGSGDEATISLLDEPIAHGLGSIPVVRFELPDELYTTDEAAIKAEEHLRLDCHKFDLLSFAHLQRYYKPVEVADNDFSESHADDDKPQLGLAYVPKLEKFEFSEPQGSILIHLFTALGAIEQQIKEMVSLQGASVEPGLLEQSGKSKEVDFVMNNEQLKAYGHLICEALQKVYRIVDRMMGRNDLLSISGLDTFDTDDVGKLIERIQGLQQIDLAALRATLPPTLYLLLLSKLMVLLVSNISASERDAIEAELQQQPDRAPLPAKTDTAELPGNR